MPYVKEQNREYFKDLLFHLKRSAIANPGELNYLFTEIVNQYFVTHSKSYQVINDVVGALECNKQEVYRRIASPYEDFKAEENGEAFGPEALK